MTITTINGKYIVHFTELLTKAETEAVNRDDINFINQLFIIAKNKARALGGKEYKGKAYGGGIAFPTREHAEQAINLLSNERYNNSIVILLEAEKYFEKSAKAWENYNNTKKTKYQEKEIEYQNEAEQRIKAVFRDIEIDYPGLYPSFKIHGHSHYTINSLIVHELRKI